mgnify:CR=1 FL=1
MKEGFIEKYISQTEEAKNKEILKKEELRQEGYKNPYPVEFFKNFQLERQSYEYIKKIAEYIDKNNIENIVLLDRSARNVCVGLREYWRLLQENEDRKNKNPHIYFTNPRGFVSNERYPNTSDKIFYDRKMKYDRQESISLIRDEEEINEDFKKTYSQLLKDRDKPLLIYDNCVHGGESLQNVLKFFEENGFSHIKIFVIHKENEDFKDKFPLDYISLDKPEEIECYPFGTDNLTEKTYTKVVSLNKEKKDKKTDKLSPEIKKAYLVRDIIKRLIKENYLKDLQKTGKES